MNGRYLLLFLLFFPVTFFGSESRGLPIIRGTEFTPATDRGALTQKQLDFFALHGQEAVQVDPLFTSPLSEQVEGTEIGYGYYANGAMRTTGAVQFWQLEPDMPGPKSVRKPVTLIWRGQEKVSQAWKKARPMCSQVYERDGKKIPITAVLYPQGASVTVFPTDHPAPPETRTHSGFEDDFESHSRNRFHSGAIALHPTRMLYAHSCRKDGYYVINFEPGQSSITHHVLPTETCCFQGIGPDQIVFGPNDCMAVEHHGQIIVNHLETNKCFTLTQPSAPFTKTIPGQPSSKQAVSDADDFERHEQWHTSHRFSPLIKFNPSKAKNQILIGQEKKLALFNALTTAIVYSTKNCIQGCAGFTASGDRLVFAEQPMLGSSCNVTTIDTTTREKMHLVSDSPPITHLCCSPLTEQVAFCTQKIFYVSSGQTIGRVFSRQGKKFSDIKWNPSEPGTVSVLDDKVVHTWKLLGESLLERFARNLGDSQEHSTQRALLHSIYDARKNNGLFRIKSNRSQLRSVDLAFFDLPPILRALFHQAALVGKSINPPRYDDVITEDERTAYLASWNFSSGHSSQRIPAATLPYETATSELVQTPIALSRTGALALERAREARREREQELLEGKDQAAVSQNGDWSEGGPEHEADGEACADRRSLLAAAKDKAKRLFRKRKKVHTPSLKINNPLTCTATLLVLW